MPGSNNRNGSRKKAIELSVDAGQDKQNQLKSTVGVLDKQIQLFINKAQRLACF